MPRTESARVTEWANVKPVTVMRSVFARLAIQKQAGNEQQMIIANQYVLKAIDKVSAGTSPETSDWAVAR